MRKLILASQSPARKKWLSKIVRARFPEIRFTVKPADLDESRLLRRVFNLKARTAVPDLKMARKMAETLARAKAEFIAMKNPGAEVLGSDQLLWLDGKILGKPGTEARARRMLKACSGNRAYLVTSVVHISARRKSRVRSKTQVTVLKFADLSAIDISRIVQLDRPLWCAGSFMFEKHGFALFESVKTDDPSGIEGFPAMRVISLLNFD